MDDDIRIALVVIEASGRYLVVAEGSEGHPQLRYVTDHVSMPVAAVLEILRHVSVASHNRAFGLTSFQTLRRRRQSVCPV